MTRRDSFCSCCCRFASDSFTAAVTIPSRSSRSCCSSSLQQKGWRWGRNEKKEQHLFKKLNICLSWIHSIYVIRSTGTKRVHCKARHSTKYGNKRWVKHGLAFSFWWGYIPLPRHPPPPRGRPKCSLPRPPGAAGAWDTLRPRTKDLPQHGPTHPPFLASRYEKGVKKRDREKFQLFRGAKMKGKRQKVAPSVLDFNGLTTGACKSKNEKLPVTSPQSPSPRREGKILFVGCRSNQINLAFNISRSLARHYNRRKNHRPSIVRIPNSWLSSSCTLSPNRTVTLQYEVIGTCCDETLQILVPDFIFFEVVSKIIYMLETPARSLSSFMDTIYWQCGDADAAHGAGDSGHSPPGETSANVRGCRGARSEKTRVREKGGNIQKTGGAFEKTRSGAPRVPDQV